MKIVIAGAGDIGFHLAKLLAHEDHSISLIDSDDDVLQEARSHVDVLTVRGDSSNTSVLKDAKAGDADLLMAVTTSEKTNLVTAILAKKMGARQTVARVKTVEYLDNHQKAMFADLGIDSIISPQQLASLEVLRLIKQCSLTDVFEFENGKISLIGLHLDDDAPIVNMTVEEVNQQHPEFSFRPLALLRNNETYIAREDTIFRRSDHLYFLAKNEDIDKLTSIIGKNQKPVKNIMIVGGSEMGLKTAQVLEHDYNVTLIDQSKSRCKQLIEHLHETLVVCADPSNLNDLIEEGLGKMDAFIALTDNSESNIIASLMAEEMGVFKTIAHVNNAHYIRLSKNIGVDTLINEKLIAANNIFRYVRKGQVEAITSIHGSDAELIEYKITKSNRVTKRPINELHLPAKAVVGAVIRKDEVLIPSPDFQLALGDKVILFAMPEAIHAVEKIFR